MMSAGDVTNVKTAPTGTFTDYRFTVIFARHKSKWLYARHRERETFETAGGHIEPYETPLDCAKRELYEETGAIKFSINPLFDYSVQRGGGISCGQAFFAEVEEIGALPESEMAEVTALDGLPEKMTYPKILPVLYREMLSLYVVNFYGSCGTGAS